MKQKMTIEYLIGKHPAMTRAVARDYIKHLKNCGIFYVSQYRIELIKDFKMLK